MKFSKLIPIILLACCVLMSTGCATVGDGKVSPQVQSTIHGAAYVGTVETLRAHPEYRLGFETAAAELKILEEGKIDSVKLMEIVNRLPVKELRSERAALIITSATILLSGQIDSMPLDKLENLKPVVASIRQGIERGLAPAP